MGRLRALWASGVGGKLLIGLGGLGIFVVVCCTGLLLITAIFRPATNTATTGSTPSAAAQAAPTASGSTEVPASTEAPTPLPEPTATPGPTNTPAPTATPVPTDLPTNTPEPTATPAPIVLEGSGQTVTDPFTPLSTANRVVASHQGRRNFALISYAPDGKSKLLINTIGNYQGVVLLATDQETYFEIDADGVWSLQIEPIVADEAAAQGATGSGDYVSGLFTPTKTGPVPYTFTHNGERNFAVYLHCAGGSDLVQNEIGAVENQAVARFREGPCLWEVQADGDWSLKPK